MAQQLYATRSIQTVVRNVLMISQSSIWRAYSGQCIICHWHSHLKTVYGFRMFLWRQVQRNVTLTPNLVWKFTSMLLGEKRFLKCRQNARCVRMWTQVCSETGPSWKGLRQLRELLFHYCPSKRNISVLVKKCFILYKEGICNANAVIYRSTQRSLEIATTLRYSKPMWLENSIQNVCFILILDDRIVSIKPENQRGA